MGCGVSVATRQAARQPTSTLDDTEDIDAEDTKESFHAVEDSIQTIHKHKQFSRFDINGNEEVTSPRQTFRQHQDKEYFYYDNCDDSGRQMNRINAKGARRSRGRNVG